MKGNLALLLLLVAASSLVSGQTTTPAVIPHPIQSGRVPLNTWNWANRCQNIAFQEEFDTSEVTVDKIHIILTVTHPTYGGSPPHDAVTAWFEDVTDKGFTLCVEQTQETAGFSDPDAAVDWNAMAHNSAPFPARVGRVEFSSATGPKCQDVTFAALPSDATAPLVLVTPGRFDAAASDRGAVSAWVSNVGATSATICVRADQSQLASMNPVTVNYMVFSSNIAEDTRFVAGSVAQGTSWRVSNVLGHEQNCVWVNFPKEFSAAPWLVVSPRADRPMKAWVESISARSFRACVQPLAEEALPAADKLLQIDWLASDASAVLKGVGRVTVGRRGSRGDNGGIGDVGADGQRGPAGRKGIEGFRGFIGARGPAGPQGDRGNAGEKGSTGPQGDEGNLGERGDKGAEGPEGFPGFDDNTGERGPPGPRGDVGPQGAKGDQGEAGPIGEEGPMGVRGPPGPRGPTGKTGAKGNTGEVGVVGERGPAGEMNEEASVPGPDGDQGPIGPRGDPGPKQTGVQGQDGPAGPRGVRGIAGVRGEQGIVGIKGVIGEKGVTGPQGVVGPKGIKGVVGIDGLRGIGGPRGPQGPRGPDGPEGPAGGQGPKGSIGPNGPRGQKGGQGPLGIAGYAGPRGMPGPTGNVGPQGPDGDRGARGSKGLPGLQGPVGPEGDKGLIGEVGPQGPKGNVGLPGPPGRRGTQAGPEGPQGKDGPMGPAGEVGDKGVPGPMGAQGPDGLDSNGGTVFYRLMTGDWLKKNGVFYDEEKDGNLEQTTMVLDSRVKASKIFGVPLFKPNELRRDRHYTVRVRVSALSLSDGADIFIGLGDGNRIAGFRRDEVGQTVISRVMHGDKREMVSHHHSMVWREDLSQDLSSVGETGYSMNKEYLIPRVAKEAYEAGMKDKKTLLLQEGERETQGERETEGGREKRETEGHDEEEDVLIEDDNEVPEPPKDPKVTLDSKTTLSQSQTPSNATKISSNGKISSNDKKKSAPLNWNGKPRRKMGSFFEIYFRFDSSYNTEVLVKTKGEFDLWQDELPFAMVPADGLTLLCYAHDPSLRYTIYSVEVEAHEETP